MITLIIFILPMLFLGTYVSTYNWNSYFHKLDRLKSEKSIAQVIAIEIRINRATCRTLLQNETLDPDFTKYYPFATSALDAALSSGVFFDENNKELLKYIVSLELTETKANYVLNLVQEAALIYPSSNRNFFKSYIQGGYIKMISTSLDSLENILLSKYNIALGDTFLYPDIGRIPNYR